MRPQGGGNKVEKIPDFKDLYHLVIMGCLLSQRDGWGGQEDGRFVQNRNSILDALNS